MHPVIYDELFDLRYRVSRSAIDFIVEELDKYELDISDISDHDHCIIIKFSKNVYPMVIGELRIDRIMSKFYISGFCNGYVLPAAGDWDIVKQYLNNLVNM